MPSPRVELIPHKKTFTFLDNLPKMFKPGEVPRDRGRSEGRAGASRPHWNVPSLQGPGSPFLRRVKVGDHLASGGYPLNVDRIVSYSMHNW